VLALLFLLVYERLFPPPKPQPGAVAADTTAAAQQATPPPAGSTSTSASGAPASAQAAPALQRPAPAVPAAKPETLTVTTPTAIVAFSNVGAAPVTVTMRDYRATVRDVAEQSTAPPVRLGEPDESLLSYALVTTHDTLQLSGTAFHTVQAKTPQGMPDVEFQADVPRPDGRTAHVRIAYAFDSGGYLSHVSGTVSGMPGASADYLLITLPSGLPSYEADTADDIRQLAYSYKVEHQDAASTSFSRLQPAKPQLVPGPVEWVAARDKYFLVGMLASDTTRPHQFAELHLAGAARVGGVAERASGQALLPLWTPAASAAPSGAEAAFAFELYTGPQDYRRLRALGRGFENLNQYGGFFHIIFQPFVTLTVLAILWMRQLLQINYGWILIIFGVVTRIILWPLNQRAMRTSLKMQRLQPEIQAVQAKYKNDQQRMQQELMRVYKEHDMSPWSPIAGCLPMLLPWPIFAALYFVFRTTIEFRGVPFLWMHDISVKDPYYIMPILMGLTSFLVSWIGMRNMPPNPQTKMMSYLFPVMMTFFFWKIAAGLNLYYFVQNLATVPQQWYLSNERAKAGVPAPGGSSSAATKKGEVEVRRRKAGG
jgi:YidC/Oxa1 family membrane protein insertase